MVGIDRVPIGKDGDQIGYSQDHLKVIPDHQYFRDGPETLVLDRALDRSLLVPDIQTAGLGDEERPASEEERNDGLTSETDDDLYASAVSS